MPDNPYDGLSRVFHEPKRLAIACALCTAGGRQRFTELRDQCEMTDGNLNRHLKTLEEAGAVRVEKAFVGVKPCTTIVLTGRGREEFLAYLGSLEQVLRQAVSAAGGRPARPLRRGADAASGQAEV